MSQKYEARNSREILAIETKVSIYEMADKHPIQSVQLAHSGFYFFTSGVSSRQKCCVNKTCNIS